MVDLEARSAGVVDPTRTPPSLASPGPPTARPWPMATRSTQRTAIKLCRVDTGETCRRPTRFSGTRTRRSIRGANTLLPRRARLQSGAWSRGCVGSGSVHTRSPCGVGADRRSCPCPGRSSRMLPTRPASLASSCPASSHPVGTTQARTIRTSPAAPARPMRPCCHPRGRH